MTKDETAFVSNMKMMKINRIISIALLCVIISSCFASCKREAIIYDVTPKLYQIEYDLQRTDTLPTFLYSGEKTVENKIFKTKKIEYLGTKYSFEYEYSMGDDSYYSCNIDGNASIKAGVNKKGEPFEFEVRINDNSVGIYNDLTVNVSEDTSPEDARREIEHRLSDIDFSEYSRFTYQEYSASVLRLTWYNVYSNCLLDTVSVDVKKDGLVKSVGISRNLERTGASKVDSDCVIDADRRHELITERLSKMYNTEQMSYKSYEIAKQYFDSELEGVMYVYDGELCILYDLNVYFAVSSPDDHDSLDSENCCMLLIPLRLIEK